MLRYIRCAGRREPRASLRERAPLGRPATSAVPHSYAALPACSNVRWQFGDITPDYLVGRDAAVLFLSLRWDAGSSSAAHCDALEGGLAGWRRRRAEVQSARAAHCLEPRAPSSTSLVIGGDRFSHPPTCRHPLLPRAQVPPAQAGVHPPPHPRAAARLPPARHPVPRGRRGRGGAAGAGERGGVAGWWCMWQVEGAEGPLARGCGASGCSAACGMSAPAGARCTPQPPITPTPPTAALHAGHARGAGQRVHPGVRLEQRRVRALPGDVQEVRAQRAAARRGDAAVGNHAPRLAACLAPALGAADPACQRPGLLPNLACSNALGLSPASPLPRPSSQPFCAAPAPLRPPTATRTSRRR